MHHALDCEPFTAALHALLPLHLLTSGGVFIISICALWWPGTRVRHVLQLGRDDVGGSTRDTGRRRRSKRRVRPCRIHHGGGPCVAKCHFHSVRVAYSHLLLYHGHALRCCWRVERKHMLKACLRSMVSALVLKRACKTYSPSHRNSYEIAPQYSSGTDHINFSFQHDSSDTMLR